jgi:chromosome segregation ATPase
MNNTNLPRQLWMLITVLLLLLNPHLILGQTRIVSANAQRNLEFRASDQDESERLRHALADALSKLEKAQTDLEAAKALITEQGKELEAANNALAASKSETDAARRVIEAGDAAIKAQQNALDSVERANAKLELLADRYEKRVEKVEEQRDKAQKRGAVMSVLNLIVGVAIGHRF